MTVNQKEAHNMELIYEGSVKRVYRSAQDSSKLYFEFSDDYSVFDWGKMPDTIQNKGRALAIMGAFFFSALSKAELWQSLKQSRHLKRFDAAWLEQRFKHPIYSGVCGVENFGIPHHFSHLIGDGKAVADIEQAQTVKEKLLMEVLAADVQRPASHNIERQILYFYPNTLPQSQSARRRLVPLEIVFRFGMPEGSSLKERLRRDSSYLEVLGLKEMPEPNQMFERPVLEFFTKLEPKDRLLSLQEAVHISGLGAHEFEYMVEMAYDTALALYVLFAERGIELWDGKVEMIVDSKGHEPGAANGGVLMLADSIGPDELRLLYKGVHLSKEIIRKIYRGTTWEKALKAAQERARREGVIDWKKICLEELGESPEPLPPSAKKSIDALYPMLVNHMTALPVFKEQPTLDDFVASLPDSMR
ncbi:MAG TPA: phosphoribosylaminoimidazolesuccinocarboxamide synthase [Candidatus Obscuribacterales bacterium]